MGGGWGGLTGVVGESWVGEAVGNGAPVAGGTVVLEVGGWELAATGFAPGAGGVGAAGDGWICPGGLLAAPAEEPEPLAVLG